MKPRLKKNVSHFSLTGTESVLKGLDQHNEFISTSQSGEKINQRKNSTQTAQTTAKEDNIDLKIFEYLEMFERRYQQDKELRADSKFEDRFFNAVMRCDIVKSRVGNMMTSASAMTLLSGSAQNYASGKYPGLLDDSPGLRRRFRESMDLTKIQNDIQELRSQFDTSKETRNEQEVQMKALQEQLERLKIQLYESSKGGGFVGAGDQKQVEKQSRLETMRSEIEALEERLELKAYAILTKSQSHRGPQKRDNSDAHEIEVMRASEDPNSLAQKRLDSGIIPVTLSLEKEDEDKDSVRQAEDEDNKLDEAFNSFTSPNRNHNSPKNSDKFKKVPLLNLKVAESSQGKGGSRGSLEAGDGNETPTLGYYSDVKRQQRMSTSGFGISHNENPDMKILNQSDGQIFNNSTQRQKVIGSQEYGGNEGNTVLTMLHTRKIMRKSKPSGALQVPNFVKSEKRVQRPGNHLNLKKTTNLNDRLSHNKDPYLAGQGVNHGSLDVASDNRKAFFGDQKLPLNPSFRKKNKEDFFPFKTESFFRSQKANQRYLNQQNLQDSPEHSKKHAMRKKHLQQNTNPADRVDHKRDFVLTSYEVVDTEESQDRYMSRQSEQRESRASGQHTPDQDDSSQSVERIDLRSNKQDSYQDLRGYNQQFYQRKNNIFGQNSSPEENPKKKLFQESRAQRNDQNRAGNFSEQDYLNEDPELSRNLCFDSYEEDGDNNSYGHHQGGSLILNSPNKYEMSKARRNTFGMVINYPKDLQAQKNILQGNPRAKKISVSHRHVSRPNPNNLSPDYRYRDQRNTQHFKRQITPPKTDSSRKRQDLGLRGYNSNQNIIINETFKAESPQGFASDFKKKDDSIHHNIKLNHSQEVTYPVKGYRKHQNTHGRNLNNPSLKQGPKIVQHKSGPQYKSKMSQMAGGNEEHMQKLRQLKASHKQRPMIHIPYDGFNNIKGLSHPLTPPNRNSLINDDSMNIPRSRYIEKSPVRNSSVLAQGSTSPVGYEENKNGFKAQKKPGRSNKNTKRTHSIKGKKGRNEVKVFDRKVDEFDALRCGSVGDEENERNFYYGSPKVEELDHKSRDSKEEGSFIDIQSLQNSRNYLNESMVSMPGSDIQNLRITNYFWNPRYMRTGVSSFPFDK